MILIPKPGKPPSIENSRPTSLSSWVGNAMEHVLMNRCQRYLEEEDLFPESILGFRDRLCTQEAMIHLKAEIIDDWTKMRDKKAVLRLDLQGAFDKFKHSAILAQVNKLNLAERSYNYIREFLTDRMAEIQFRDLKLEEKQLGSSGSPQGSVISPMLFNIVMISVCRRLYTLADVRHRIYADDITLWAPGGRDGFIEASLQRAVEPSKTNLTGRA